MPTQHKISCPNCSESLVVALTQAGETAQCPCGEVVSIPSLLKLKKMPTVETASGNSKARSWSALQGWLFATGLVMAFFGGYLHLRMNPARQSLITEKPSLPEFIMDIQDISKEKSWDYWQQVQTYNFEFRDFTPRYLANRKAHRELSYYVWFGWALAAIGTILMLVALALGLLGSGQRDGR